jgi:hypothetical protein
MTAALTPEQRISELQADVAHKDAVIEQNSRDAMKHIKALEAELAACKLDAERWSFSVGEGKCFSMRWIAIYAEWDGDGDFADAIDAAMAAGEPK